MVPALLGLVRFAHTVFALPFALAGALLAERALPPLATVGWILVAMAAARSLAMALNRLIDAEIDARNPRTAARELPAGRLSRRQVVGFCAVSLLALLVAVSQLPSLIWWLWPIPVALFVLYPYTKRFTWACHLVLGITIGLAPLGGWIAVTGELAAAPIWLAAGVAAWIAGFDVIYALLDLEFDRAHGLLSIPRAFGPAGALAIARCLHLGALAAMVAAGILAESGPLYFAGIAACGVILLYEHGIARSLRPADVQRAFGSANALIAVTFLAAVVLDLIVTA